MNTLERTLETLKTRCRHCTLEYTKASNGVWYRTRCIPDEGFYPFEVMATYSKRRMPNGYYVLARNVTDAKKYYKAWYGYDVVSVRKLEGDEAEAILTNTLLMPER